ncbi:chemotaxis protein CheW [Celerinatantimonas diazotrophica]|uniref:Purine-binding chemotaxis protein CheW n=1 Tax=Celerinatantimonas diazotrophica TaxID=412034 RepID=A0A4R1JMC1_9GAMM|nr:chemotaxis protein CheW [Celerinatantimonas diazotrophica]TCK52110.1 purine-binding chemotaxis protein CheW [Celerinatantimonas diazotrophica]CAG9296185.1 hypothetical protein CEDIAZO_01328 [Celerinatantimonas diazotrophica]
MSLKNDEALADYFMSLFADTPEENVKSVSGGLSTQAEEQTSQPLSLSLQASAKARAPVSLSQAVDAQKDLYHPRAKPLAQLLEQANESQNKPFAEPSVELPEILPVLPEELTPTVESVQPEVTEPEIVEQNLTQVEVETQSEPAEPQWHNIDVEAAFQALFFDVAGITYAVPLAELGGIHRITEITSLFGKPKWFAGIMAQREEKFNAVDMARWVMPNEQWDLDYQYLVMLTNSDWGLCCEHLKGTEWLNQDDVKWRQSPGKRPWLAGMIKKRMCALIHVSELVNLLDKGVDVDGR